MPRLSDHLPDIPGALKRVLPGDAAGGEAEPDAASNGDVNGDGTAPSPSSQQPSGAHKKPGSFLTYAQTQLDGFDARPLCLVDSLVLSWLAYFRLTPALEAARTDEGIALHELMRAEDFDEMFGTSFDADGSRELLFAVCASPRFRSVRLTRLRFKTDADVEEQFAAMTFLLPTGEAYLAFRGTDSSLVGWKEDFNMASSCPVPAQEEARAYVERVAPSVAGPLYLGGHSKGGNLAVYAAATVPRAVQDRVLAAFSHDGPGFPPAFLEGEGYRRVRGRVAKMVPKSSVIGLIMDDGADVRVVESSGVSILQHNPFLWEVEGRDFVYADGLTASARYLSSTIESWMNRFEPEERRRFIDTLFDVLGATGAERFADIRDDWRTSVPAMREAVDALDPEQRECVGEVVRALARTATIDKVADAAGNLLDGLGSKEGD
ncbi:MULTISPECIES: DUF2974 domain-containing protein [Enorma]|uniref:DUF2974 domain-containing protein n=1 Tax=Enorma TaxID=1472762 RepID=UPI00034901E2|nr:MULTISPECIES: DUF2974 domain-containing protein [Enorma]